MKGGRKEKQKHFLAETQRKTKNNPPQRRKESQRKRRKYGSSF